MAAMNMNREQFDEMIRSGKTFLVDYWAPWCGYCRKIEAAYEAVSETWGRSIPVAKINIDEEEQLSDSQGIEIIPTLVLYKDGKAAATLRVPESTQPTASAGRLQANCPSIRKPTRWRLKSSPGSFSRKTPPPRSPVP